MNTDIKALLKQLDLKFPITPMAWHQHRQRRP